MILSPGRLTHPAVRALVTALNGNDEQAFFAALTPDATMSDDGSDRDLREWCEREIFTTRGHLDVQSRTRACPSWRTTATTPGARCVPAGGSRWRTGK